MTPESARQKVSAELAHATATLPLPTSIGILREARVVGIVGSRGYPELERVDALVAQLHPDAIVISGGAEGVDRRATSAALGTDRPSVELKPIGSSKHQWTTAAFWRNGAIARCADIVVAFWDGESPGTADTIKKALAASGKVIVALPACPPEVWVPRI